MKVKVGNQVYDPNQTPVMVILTEKDKQNILNMLPEATKYCAYPEEMDQEEIQEWMDDIGGWYPRFSVKKDGDKDNYAFFRCPVCDDLGNIDQDQYEGKVSILCDCSFHVTVDLRSYIGYKNSSWV